MLDEFIEKQGDSGMKQIVAAICALNLLDIANKWYMILKNYQPDESRGFMFSIQENDMKQISNAVAYSWGHSGASHACMMRILKHDIVENDELLKEILVYCNKKELLIELNDELFKNNTQKKEQQKKNNDKLMEEYDKLQKDHNNLLKDHNNLLKDHEEFMIYHGELIKEHKDLLKDHKNLLKYKDELINRSNKVLKELDNIMKQQDEMLWEQDEMLWEQDEMIDELLNNEL